MGLSTGVGPLTLFTGTGGGSRGTSVAAQERAMGRAHREQQIALVAQADQMLQGLMKLHIEEFVSPSRPIAESLPPVKARVVRRSVRSKAASGIPTLKLGERAKAKHAVEAEVAEAIAAAERGREAAQQAEQAKLDEHWNRFLSNDPDLILPVLEAAFEDNQAPAAAVGCEDGTAYIVLRWPTLNDSVGDRKFAHTPSGWATHHKRSLKERNLIYLEAMSSSVLATAKEALAVAPGLKEVSLVVVRGDRDIERGGTVLVAICAVTVRRGDLRRVGWSTVEASALLRSLRGARLQVKGTAREIMRLDVEYDPDFAAGLASVAEGMGWKIKPQPGGRVGAWVRRASDWVEENNG